MKRTRSLSVINHVDSFENIVEKISKSTPNPQKRVNLKTNQDVINFTTTFKPIDTKKKQLLLKSADSKVEIIAPRNASSPADYFLLQFNEKFLDALIEYNSSIHNLKNLPSLFSRTENSRAFPDIQQAKRDFVISFYATKLYIQHKPEQTLAENFKSGSSINVPEFPQFSMSRATFDKMNANFLIPMSLVHYLNENMMSLVRTGRVVVLDEKHKTCSKAYNNGGHARWAKKKYGHWFTESAVLGPKTGLPIIITLMPLTNVDPKNVEDEPYNNVPNSKLVEEAYKGMEPESILLTDGYYPDMNVRK